MTDCTLTNQLGAIICSSDFKGKALAFTFIFTRCPFPNYCPCMDNNMSAAQHQLTGAGVATNWHLLPISFDPEYNTPDRPAKYADAYDFTPAHFRAR